MALLEAVNIKKAYGKLPILNGISLEVQAAEVVAILGPSGAGKSTLLQILGTLDKPDSGEVRLKGHNLHKLPDKKIAEIRNKEMGFVFQFHNLLPEFSALENVCIPAWIQQQNSAEITRKAEKLLDFLGVLPRASHKPSELSGGEQQRVAVARALINDPAVIFADEPSGNLDTRNAKELHDLFFRLREELQMAFVIVTHNPELGQMADRRIHLKPHARA
jgi:lipoprotein-releasing system ATP-binding protein